MSYSKLNNIFDKYLKSHSDCFFVSNLDFASNFLEKGTEKINLFKIIEAKRVNLNLDEKVSKTESLDLVIKFLSSLNDNYLENFKQAINNGGFIFENSSKVNGSYCEDGKCIIDLKGAIIDSTVILHEYFHLLNNENSKLAPIFTEAVSIYMENKFLDFLIETGYSRLDVAKIRMIRYFNFYRTNDELSFKVPFLNLKKKLGHLDEDSYIFISRYSKELNFPNMPKENFLYFLEHLDEVIQKEDKDGKEFEPDYIFQYYLGTAYSSYLLMQDNSLDKVLALNEYMMQPTEITNIETAFKILGIRNKDDMSFIEATNEYYQKEALIYKNNNSKQLNKENTLHT